MEKNMHPFGERLSRRRLLALGGAMLAAELTGLRGVLAKTGPAMPIRIGVVTPTKTGGKAIEASLYDVVGEAARMGALLAEGDVGTEAEELGMHLDILPASSPSAEAALRAGERLVATEEVCALVGGIGEDQAEVLAQVAANAGLPFFNIGSQRDALRGTDCRRTSFHVEASAAMYLDALAISFKKAGQQRCFVIHADTDDGAALKDRAQDALTRNGIDAAGVAGVAPGQPVYSPEFDAIRKGEADVVLVLLGARDQIAFLSQYDSMGPDIALAPYPHPVTQTRDYFATASYLAHKAGSGRRMVLWETTLQAHGAGPLNEDYMAHWGAPMNPTAWAAYQAIKMLVETVQVTGTTEASQLIAHLENPTTVFDVAKGPGTSFRPWDHQLRQPLYLDDIDAEAEYGITLTQLLPIAKFVGEIPDMEGEAGNRMERLDKLGDGPGTSPCKF